MHTTAAKFRLIPTIEEYSYQQFPEYMEFEVKVLNPCVTGNSILFRNSEFIEIGKVSLKATYSKEAIDLDGMFVDSYSKQIGSN